jgi:hypothetical protein
MNNNATLDAAVYERLVLSVADLLWQKPRLVFSHPDRARAEEAVVQLRREHPARWYFVGVVPEQQRRT